MAEEELNNDVDINDDEEVDDDIGDDEEAESIPSKTYKVENGRITSKIDGLDAMVQFVEKCLSTDRFTLDIYSENYGHDLMDLIGKDKDLAIVESERMVTEALEADDRITNVTITDVYFDNDGNLMLYGNVDTVFGKINLEQEV